ncbi:MAG: iron ABC transporter permease [Anaerolineales bacterium]|nr:iron ABC transporter permease [Anaerolineales bacterium]
MKHLSRKIFNLSYRSKPLNRETALSTSKTFTHTVSRSQALVWLTAILIGVFFMSIFLGRYPKPGFMSLERLFTEKLAQSLVLNLRLPRLLTAMLLGMSLSVAGAVFQMIFGNPLVEPGFLGVSQGASFGAAFSIIFLSNSAWMVQTAAATFALFGLGLSYLLARRVRLGGWVLRLVLAGIAVSALFSSGLGVLKYIADPLSQLPEITFWLLGGLWSITWTKFIFILPASVLGLLIAYRMRWRINILSLSDETAFSLGAAPGRERTLLLVASVIAVSAVISVAGMVGWVGLIIPHIARRIFGADARYVLPASMLIGAIFAVLCDDLGRTLFSGEIPLGILTSLFGATIFMILMMRQTTLVQK